MRWIPLVITTCLVLVVQVSLGRVLTFELSAVGTVGPDLLAILVLFVALYGRRLTDVLLAAWLAGLAVDLATAGGPAGPTVIGPMSLAYVSAAWLVYRVRDAIFRDRAIPRALLGLVFVLVAHWIWVTLQLLVAWGVVSWSCYPWRMGQVALVAAYTGVLTPLGQFGLDKARRWLITTPAGRSRRRR